MIGVPLTRLALAVCSLYARWFRVLPGYVSAFVRLGGSAAAASGVHLTSAPRRSLRSPSPRIEQEFDSCRCCNSARPHLSPHGVLVKRTYQPKARRRSRKHGFRHRMSDRAGQAIVKARRRKGRHRLSA